jgi:hypothetical protein
VPIEQRGDAFPHCGGYQLQPNGGTELRVLELLVADDEPGSEVNAGRARNTPA